MTDFADLEAWCRERGVRVVTVLLDQPDAVVHLTGPGRRQGATATAPTLADAVELVQLRHGRPPT